MVVSNSCRTNRWVHYTPVDGSN